MSDGGVFVTSGTDVNAQTMSTEQYTCLDDISGSYYTSSMPCDFDGGVNLHQCSYCQKSHDSDENRLAHEKVCTKKPDDDGNFPGDKPFGDDNTFGEGGCDSGSSSGKSGNFSGSSATVGSKGGDGSGKTKITPSQASKAVIKEVSSQYGNLAACNIGVQKMFTTLYGKTMDSALKGRANDIAKQLRTSRNWIYVGAGEGGIRDVKKYAAEGWFVVGAWYNSCGHGHVVVIMPDGKTFDCGTSGSEYMPGKRDDRSWTFSFGRDKQPYTNFYRYKEKY